jgi:hypothetical protein
MTGQGKATGSRRVAVGTPAIDPLEKPVYLATPVARTPGVRVGRVFGYLGLTLLWLAILGVAVFATVLALPGALSTVDGGLGSSTMWQRSDVWLAPIAVLLVAAVLGYLTVFVLLASVGLLLAAATLFVRSLSPAYRDEQLSMTRRSTRGEAVGPITTAFTGVALSLLPVRMTRWTKIVMIVQFNGWIINGSAFLIGFAWGCLYLFTVGWMLWPASGVALPICIAVSVVLLAWVVVTVWRRRKRFPTVMPESLRGTVYELSWPNTAPQKRTATRTKH